MVACDKPYSALELHVCRNLDVDRMVAVVLREIFIIARSSVLVTKGVIVCSSTIGYAITACCNNATHPCGKSPTTPECPL